MIYILLIIIAILYVLNKKNTEKYTTYNPDKWNKDRDIRASHNCYSYALDDISSTNKEKCSKMKNCYKLRHRPGRHSGKKKYKYYTDLMTCDVMGDGIIDDNPSIYKIDNKSKCKDGFYKIANAVDSGKTFHFWRQDNNGMWSHKDGYKPVTNLDDDGELIPDPEKSSRDKYPDFCGYYCVPENNMSKTYSSKKLNLP